MSGLDSWFVKKLGRTQLAPQLTSHDGRIIWGFKPRQQSTAQRGMYIPLICSTRPQIKIVLQCRIYIYTAALSNTSSDIWCCPVLFLSCWHFEEINLFCFFSISSFCGGLEHFPTPTKEWSLGSFNITFYIQ